MMDWMINQIPVPQIECGDIDLRADVTINDAAVIFQWAYHNWDFPLVCTTTLPPFAPIPSDSFLVYYDDRFPAGDSQITLSLYFQDRSDLPYPLLAQGLSLPMLIDVAGEAPEVDVENLDPDSVWYLERGETMIDGAAPGHALLGFVGSTGSTFMKLASVRLSLPPSLLDRVIHLQWTALPPHNVPMVVHSITDFPYVSPSEPYLFPCRVHVTGDLQENEGVSSADIVLLVNVVFKGDAAPAPCLATGDVDCNGTVTSADIIRLINHVFKGGAQLCNVCALVADGTWACP